MNKRLLLLFFAVFIAMIKELMADRGRPHDNLYEVALWEDMLTVQGDEAFYAYMVDNQAIVIPETIDAIRALTSLEEDGGVHREDQRNSGYHGDADT